MWLVKRFFHDKRFTVGLLLLWMVTVCTIFYILGAFHMGYMHIGPGEDTVFMGLKIDSWGKWMALAIFSFCNTGINEFISNALDPWFLNSLQDHKTRSIEYSHATCLWIVQIHCIYVHVMGIFALFLFFSQVDFAIIRLLADLLVTGYSTVWFIQHKRVVPAAAGKDRCQEEHLMAAVHDDKGGDDEDDCDDIQGCCYDEENPARAGKKPSDAIVLSNLHRAVSGGGAGGSSGSRGVGIDVSPKFSLFDIDEEQDGNATGATAAPRSDSIMEGDEDDLGRMLPLSLSSLPAPAAEDTRKNRRKKEQQEEGRRKLKPPPEAHVAAMHAMLPSQTTIAQRNEDTRP